MNTPAAKATLSNLETRLNAAMQAKLNKVLSEPYCKTCHHGRSEHGESGVVCFVDGCPCCNGPNRFRRPFAAPPTNGHITSVDHMGAVEVGEGCVLEVASDTVAVKACMAAWAERLMREEGVHWEKVYFRTISEAKEIAFAAVLKGKP